MVFQFYIKKGKINGIEHAGGVRRGVASICDRSFDLTSILGKFYVGSNYYILMKSVKSIKWSMQEVSGGVWLQFAIGHST